MRNRRFISMLIACAALFNIHGQQSLKVACVGNSITYGTGTGDPEHNSYPSVLDSILGSGYEVRNFGRPGATLLNNGHNPYMKSIQFSNALAYKPDIVVIHLGVNDTDPRNWPNHGGSFEQDYKALIDSFKTINPHSRIIIANLSPLTAKHHRFSTGTRDWRNSIRDRIKDIAKTNGYELIDFGELLRDYPNLISDAVHPDAKGAVRMANYVKNAITGKWGGLHLPEIYSDGMVLQRYRPIQISGRADAGAIISVNLAGHKTTANADNLGRWRASLPPMREC